ncbi:hypothetical protein JOY44_16085 [Phormidium sp. CLA17]|uniref:hypothetical protein n=1 Tax=Leptolyngbya sp. Cla-17 TaxID=2803751 RepID=UPI001492FCC4|nr:hypothetical protein [Leptolyngbya sp. Cla-17]MBM0743108.1 hypothetical protein [Leptolyngbya sp. Cla-17]
MRLAIVSLGTIATLFSLTTAIQAVPSGSASSLSGLQERSVRRTSAPSSVIPLANQKVQSNSDVVGLRLNPNLQLRVSPERDKNLSGVYPEDSTASGNRIQLLYRIDQLQSR